MIFVSAHGDLFHEDVPDAWIDQVFAVMALCPQHTFQVLTKRPERARAYLTTGRAHPVGLEALGITLEAHGKGMTGVGDGVILQGDGHTLRCATLPNVWLGVSAEDQAAADARIPVLLETPAAVRFLSLEPLLGPMDVARWLPGSRECANVCGWRAREKDVPGEGAVSSLRRRVPRQRALVAQRSRPVGMHRPRAAVGSPKRLAEGQSVGQGAVPFFFKQWGEWLPAYEADDGAETFMVPADGGDHFRLGDVASCPVDRASFADHAMWRVGKGRAGRLLDGVVHDGFPGRPA